MTNLDPPLNDVERRHSDAIRAVGNDPADWLIESQLATWEQNHGWPLTSEQAAEARRLSGEAASRFELAECLELYSLAAAHIRTMQAMSFDRQDFRSAQFDIATDPGSLLHPYVQAEWHAGVPVDDRESAHSSVIWMPVNTLQVFGSVVGVISHRLMRRFGDLPTMLAAFAQGLTWDESLEVLRRDRLQLKPDVIAPTIGRTKVFLPNSPDLPPNLRDSIAEGAAALRIMVTTFVAGHEAGHLYLGHFGDRVLIEPISGGDIPPSLRREMAADTVGIGAVWDGLESNGLGSIDYTWPGPIIALAASAGIAAAHPQTDADTANDTWADWVYRLCLAVRVLGRWLIDNGFGLSRSRPILVGAAPLAACVYEYVRTGGDLADAHGRLGVPGDGVYAKLEGIAFQLLDEFG